MENQTFFGELFEGLRAHEILLMVFGSLLFLVLLFILVFYVVKNRPLKGVLVFFLLPVIMIGFSSFKKIEFLGMVAELKDKVEEIDSKEKPSEQDIIEMKKDLAKIGDRRLSNPESLTSISKASALIGDTLKAINYAEQTIEIAPNYAPVRDYHESLITQDIIQQGIEQLEKNPDDPEVRRTLDKRTDILEKKNVKSVDNLIISAKAREVLGEFRKAADLSKSALKINPENVEAKELNRRVKR
jgi:tetratricopeptide (TPR) repeat protein